MRKLISSTVAILAIAVFATGCAGPEEKLGRGISNVTELARMGEIRRSMEQTALWEGADKAYTTGVIRGFNKSTKTIPARSPETVRGIFLSGDQKVKLRFRNIQMSSAALNKRPIGL